MQKKLNRFDGSRFVTYRNAPGVAFPKVQALCCEDEHGNV